MRQRMGTCPPSGAPRLVRLHHTPLQLSQINLLFDSIPNPSPPDFFKGSPCFHGMIAWPTNPLLLPRRHHRHHPRRHHRHHQRWHHRHHQRWHHRHHQRWHHRHHPRRHHRHHQRSQSPQSHQCLKLISGKPLKRQLATRITSSQHD